ncbi:uncharacterized protein LOC127079004 [Lathyrus oleraceus]|uniref:uncharacterized protein LOC127079004 n=1 Tax=Pisum sativum TaxID=3888 RepID=UPI0021D25FFD|nr:uncharacterized protein LOC127079004 [Pisum sativum]
MDDLVLDVSPLSTIHPPSQKKATPYVSKNVETSSKSSVSKPIIPNEDKTVVEEGSRSKGSEMKNPTMHVGGTENQMEAERSSIDKKLRKFVTSMLKEVNLDVFRDVQTYLEKETSPDNDSSEKVEENVPEHAALERRSKKKVDECVPEHDAYERRSKKKIYHVVNVDELTSDEEPLTNIMTPVVTPTRKRKVVSSNDSEFEVEKDVQNITLVRRFATKKPHVIAPEAPMDNVSLHYMKNAERWKYVIQRRVALEMELGKDALKFKEVVDLIEAVRSIKTVTKFGPCYKSLVKEFVVTIPDGCDDVKSED